MPGDDHNAYVTQRCHVTAEDPPVHCDRAIHPFDDGMILGGDQGRSVIHSLNVAASSFGPAQSHYATHPSGGGADPPSGDHDKSATQRERVAAPLDPAYSADATPTDHGGGTFSGDQGNPATQSVCVAAFSGPAQSGSETHIRGDGAILSGDHRHLATYMGPVAVPFDPAQPGYVIQVWNGGANLPAATTTSPRPSERASPPPPSPGCVTHISSGGQPSTATRRHPRSKVVASPPPLGPARPFYVTQ